MFLKELHAVKIIYGVQYAEFATAYLQLSIKIYITNFT